jgi:ACS family hexuronate transporter-like MFS transporter
VRERALATGLFNAGSNVGAVVAPLAVPWIALRWGWRPAFLLTGALGFLWIVPWLLIYREAPAAEGEGSAPAPRIPWLQLIPHRQTWALMLARFLTDPFWWFYLYWVPKFLHTHHHIELAGLALPLLIIYLAADVGSVCGGWISAVLIRRGWSVNAARKTAMLIAAVSIVPVAAAPWVSNLWTVVALLGLATAGHQGWSANIFTMVSDMFPKQAVASMVGLSGFAGSIAGMLVASATGLLLQFTGSYVPVFAAAASAYLLALGLLHLIVPDLARVDPAAGGECA